MKTPSFTASRSWGIWSGRSLKIDRLVPDTGVDETRRFVGEGGKRFVMLHISGLEFIGMELGMALSGVSGRTHQILTISLLPLLNDLKRKGNYLLIVTSDHAGHGKYHGTNHPEDYRLPFIILSDIKKFPDIQGSPYHVTELRSIVSGALK